MSEAYNWWLKAPAHRVRPAIRIVAPQRYITGWNRFRISPKVLPACSRVGAVLKMAGAAMKASAAIPPTQQVMAMISMMAEMVTRLRT